MFIGSQGQGRDLKLQHCGSLYQAMFVNKSLVHHLVPFDDPWITELESPSIGMDDHWE